VALRPRLPLECATNGTDFAAAFFLLPRGSSHPDFLVTGSANMTVFQRVLCLVDFSETSSRALLFAERLARETGAELILLHAFDAPASYDAAGQHEPARPIVKEATGAGRILHRFSLDSVSQMPLYN